MRLPRVLAVLGAPISALSIAACDPTDLVTALARQGAAAVRQDAIVREPRSVNQALLEIATELQASESGTLEVDDGDRRLRTIRRFLDGELETLRKFANDEGAVQLESVLVDGPLDPIPPISLQVVPELRPCACASRGREPVIQICLGYLMNIAVEAIIFAPGNLSGTFGQAFDGPERPLAEFGFGLLERQMTRALNDIAVMIAVFEFREAVLFSLAHEVAHIWLDTENDESQAMREVRADSVGLYLASSVSPAVKRKAEMVAEFQRNLDTTVRDPVEIALLGAELGPETVFGSFTDYCFEEICYGEGDDDHLPIQARLESSTAEAGRLIEQVVDQSTDADVARRRALRDLKDALLGF